MARPPIPQKRRLSLRPEHQANTPISQRSKQTIDDIIKKTRNPFGQPTQLQPKEVDNLEKSLRKLERELVERERTVQELELKLAEQERDIWEAEALLKAREQLLQSKFKEATEETANPEATTNASPQEREALEKLKEELDNQEQTLKEQKALLKEREDFLEQSENTLFEKTIAQQEMQTELEQRKDDLDARERRLNKEAGIEEVEPPKELG